MKPACLSSARISDYVFSYLSKRNIFQDKSSERKMKCVFCFKYNLSSVYNFITFLLVFEILIQTRGNAPKLYLLCISKTCLLHSQFYAVASCITLQKTAIRNCPLFCWFSKYLYKREGTLQNYTYCAFRKHVCCIHSFKQLLLALLYRKRPSGIAHFSVGFRNTYTNARERSRIVFLVHF